MAEIKKGDRVRIVAGPHAGKLGVVHLALGSLNVRGDWGGSFFGKHDVELVEAAVAPPPPPYRFTAAANPDGYELVPADARHGLPALVASGALAERLFRHRGGLWIAARRLAPDALGPLRDDLAAGALGLHLSELGGDGLAAWLGWDGLGVVRRLSFNAAFLGGKGVEALLASGRLGQVELLDLSVCDPGKTGLRALNASDALPALRALYLDANPDGDRSKYDAKALEALLRPQGRKPIGASLRGLEVLGLRGWSLVDAGSLLAGSELVAALGELWIDERPPGRRADGRTNTAEVPEPVRPRCVVGLARTPLAAPPAS